MCKGVKRLRGGTGLRIAHDTRTNKTASQLCIGQSDSETKEQVHPRGCCLTGSSLNSNKQNSTSQHLKEKKSNPNTCPCEHTLTPQSPPEPESKPSTPHHSHRPRHPGNASVQPVYTVPAAELGHGKVKWFWKRTNSTKEVKMWGRKGLGVWEG